MSKDLLSIILSLVVLVGVIFGLYYAWNAPGRTYYEGVEVFPTERDYVEFKMSFTRPEVWLVDAVVLASEPPIIVKFKAKVLNYNYYFPYGQKTIEGYLSKGAGGLVVFIFFCLSGLLFAWVPIWSMHSRFNK